MGIYVQDNLWSDCFYSFCRKNVTKQKIPTFPAAVPPLVRHGEMVGWNTKPRMSSTECCEPRGIRSPDCFLCLPIWVCYPPGHNMHISQWNGSETNKDETYDYITTTRISILIYIYKKKSLDLK